MGKGNQAVMKFSSLKSWESFKAHNTKLNIRIIK